MQTSDPFQARFASLLAGAVLLWQSNKITETAFALASGGPSLRIDTTHVPGRCKGGILQQFVCATLCTVVLALPALAVESAMVVGVIDGDTIKLLSQDKVESKCRLYGIDAPEKRQPFGEPSKQSLSELVFGRAVIVEVLDVDRYGRQICKLTQNGKDINLEQVSRGMAWMYTRYTKDPVYQSAQATAKQRRLGLWVDQHPIPPWEFRKKS